MIVFISSLIGIDCEYLNCTLLDRHSKILVVCEMIFLVSIFISQTIVDHDISFSQKNW